MDNKLATFCIILVVSAVLSSSYVSRVNTLSIRPPVSSPVSPEYDEDSGGGGAGGGGGGGYPDHQEFGGDEEAEEDQDQLVNWGEQDVQALTKRILKSLGLKKVPDMSKVNISEEEMDMINQKYLKHVENMERQRRAAEDHDNGEEILLYTYQNKSDVHSQHPHLLNSSSSNNTNQTSTTLYFPVDNLTNLTEKNSQATMSARLRLKHNLTTLKKHLDINSDSVERNQINSGDGNRPSSVVISVYHVTQTQSGQQLTLLDSKTVTVDVTTTSTGVNDVTLDVSSAVIGWVRDRGANHGLVLACTHCDKLMGVESGSTGGSHWQLEVRVASGERHGRSKRSYPKFTMNLFGDTISSSKATDCGKNKGGGQRHCCRKPLNVSFEELGMNKWVMSPKFFNAYYCVGKCPHGYSPENTHAVIQSLLHRKNKKRAPKLCCTPSKVSDIIIWYFDDSDPPQLKDSIWKGVVVEKCGCS